jgi:beta-lactamase superfamily II metal-dependent hydrolase
MLVPFCGVEEDSFNPVFLNSVGPRYVIMSTGRVQIAGGFRGKAMQKRADENFQKYAEIIPANRLYRTDKDKAVIITTDGSSLDVTSLAEIRGERTIKTEDADVQETGW